jgi:hypothetical protein
VSAPRDKPLLVGELNPYGVEPAMALYPLPERASGGRLAAILGLSRTAYLRSFDRVNLCVGRWWLALARDRASDILWDRLGGVRDRVWPAPLEVPGTPFAGARWKDRPDDRRWLILLGAKVSKAFGRPYLPFTKDELCRIVVLPHPSGLNRAWNMPGAADAARRLVADLITPPGGK